ncbi:hypothetical protein ES705_50570 [subsurface metagenome]
MQCACMEHMWRRLESARVHRVAIPFGKLKAGEKERCGQISRGVLRHEKDVGAGKAGSSGGDNIAGGGAGDGLGINGVAENVVARGMVKQKQRKGQAI